MAAKGAGQDGKRVKDFSVTTKRGLGRRSLEIIPEWLRIHAVVAGL
jgi:hypothetical protein